MQALLEALIKRAYCEQLQSVKDSDVITKLEGKKHGRPTTLPKEMENSLKEDIHKLRLNGSIVNKMILISATHGIVEYYNKSRVLGIKSCLGPIIYV